MAKVYSGYHSGYVGKAGGLVGYRRRGEYIVRAWVPVRNPQTKGQLFVRECFAMTNHILANLWPAAGANGGWHDLAMTTTPNLTARQLFIKNNSTICWKSGSAEDDVHIDYDKLIMQKAYGNVAGIAPKGPATSDDPTTVHIGWYDNSSYNENTSSSDIIIIAMYDPDKEAIYVGHSSRSQLSADIDLKDYGFKSGDPVHVWAWAKSSKIFPEAANDALNGGRLYRHYFSDSTYLGKIVLG